MSYCIRWAKQEEWIPAMDMIWRTFLKYDGQDCTEEGIRNFYEFITDKDLYKAFLTGRYQMLVALDGDQVIGVGSLRNTNHLSLLFVEEHYHLQGIGRELMNGLCEYLKNEVGERYMSLTAAPYAVGFYKRLGFNQVRPEASYSGIRVTTMEKVF